MEFNLKIIAIFIFIVSNTTGEHKYKTAHSAKKVLKRCYYSGNYDNHSDIVYLYDDKGCQVNNHYGKILNIQILILNILNYKGLPINLFCLTLYIDQSKYNLKKRSVSNLYNQFCN